MSNQLNLTKTYKKKFISDKTHENEIYYDCRG